MVIQAERSDSNRISPQQVNRVLRSVVHLLQPDHLGRVPRSFRYGQKITIRSQPREAVLPRKPPDDLIRSLPGESPSGNVGRAGKEFGQRLNQLGRKVIVGEKLQRPARARISLAAYSRAAPMSSDVSHGKSSRISVREAPDASRLRMSATAVREPRMIGTPQNSTPPVSRLLTSSGSPVFFPIIQFNSGVRLARLGLRSRRRSAQTEPPSRPGNRELAHGKLRSVRVSDRRRFSSR